MPVLPNSEIPLTGDGIVVCSRSPTSINPNNLMSVPRESLRHDICKHIIGRTIFNIDPPLFNMIPDKVELNIDALREITP